MNRTNHVDRHDRLLGSAWTRRPGCAPRLIPLIVITLGLAGYLEARAQEAATAVATVTNGSVDSIVITDGGSGYETPPDITFVGGGGSGASAIAQLSDGIVSQIVIQTPGNGYTTAPVVDIAPPPTPVTPAALSLSLVPKLNVTGEAWTIQQIQYADALGDPNQWFTLTNLVLGDQPYVFVDEGLPPGGRRFYRVVTLAAPGPNPARHATGAAAHCPPVPMPT